MKAVAVFVIGLAVGWLIVPREPALELEIPPERLAVLDNPARNVPAVTWAVWPMTLSRGE